MDKESSKQIFKISRISIISSVLLFVSIIGYLINLLILKKTIIMSLILILWVTSLILGIVDILSKGRRKILSLITVIVSGIPLAIVVVIVIMYSNIPSPK